MSLQEFRDLARIFREQPMGEFLQARFRQQGLLLGRRSDPDRKCQEGHSPPRLARGRQWRYETDPGVPFQFPGGIQSPSLDEGGA
ncbi:hypothetical protein GQR99_21485 (plasmid) [Cereibacter sphaeroides]|nr:hypothetical protein GQR99_21485 [Cereibacter sphaeroides]